MNQITQIDYDMYRPAVDTMRVYEREIAPDSKAVFKCGGYLVVAETALDAIYLICLSSEPAKKLAAQTPLADIRSFMAWGVHRKVGYLDDVCTLLGLPNQVAAWGMKKIKPDEEITLSFDGDAFDKMNSGRDYPEKAKFALEACGLVSQGEASLTMDFGRATYEVVPQKVTITALSSEWAKLPYQILGYPRF